MPQPIQEFESQINSLQEVDIGDFRRRLTLYINRLQEELPQKPSITKTIEEMKHAVLYEPHLDIENIRESILQKIKNLQ